MATINGSRINTNNNHNNNNKNNNTNLLPPIASISSIKMIQGLFDFATSNSSRTLFAPTPTYISSNSDPDA